MLMALNIAMGIIVSTYRNLTLISVEPRSACP